MPTAEIFSITTGKPIGDGASQADPVALLSLIVRRAMLAGADPSAVVSADHDLLVLCDDITMRKRQCDQIETDWRALPPNAPGRDMGYAMWRQTARVVRSRLHMLRKLRATTSAGVFAKAAVVAQTKGASGMVAISLASDLLNSAELRMLIWPVAMGKY